MKTVVKNVWRLLRRTFVIQQSKKPTTSAAEHAFAQENRAFWDRLFEGRKEKGKGVVVTEVLHIAYFAHLTSSLGRVVAEAQKLNQLALTLPGAPAYSSEVLRSYGQAALFSIGNMRYLWYRLIAQGRAWYTFRKLKDPEDLLHLHIDGIEMGSLVYDNYLRWDGFATLSRLDHRVRRYLQQLYESVLLVRFLMRRYEVRYGVFSHVSNIPEGIFALYLAHHGVPILHCRSAATPALMVYRSVQEVRRFVLRPVQALVDQLSEEERAEMIRRADAYLEQRLQQEVGDWNAALAYDPRKKVVVSREVFADQYGLDARKKNVFVMLHAFNDFPHFQGADSILFPDYYHWLKATLHQARHNRHVNWVFKEHPAARFYRTRDLDLQDEFGALEEEHIVFLDREADFNAQSIRYLADVIITCLGTAGLEFSALGVPCVLGGQSTYSDFGFTHEPSSREAYEELLRRVQTLDELSEAQRNQARIVMYLQLVVLQNRPWCFEPDPDHYIGGGRFGELNVKRGIDLDPFWSRAAAWLRTVDLETARAEVDKLLDYIRADRGIQFVDLEQFPFLQAAIRRCGEEQAWPDAAEAVDA